MTYPSELRKAIARLEASDTRQKRLNARKGLRLLLNRIERESFTAYPLIDKEGKEVIKPKQPCCPACKAPMKNWKALAKHVTEKHTGRNIGIKAKCWCEWEWVNTGWNGAKHQPPLTQLARHLSSQRDLAGHCLIGLLEKAGKP